MGVLTADIAIKSVAIETPYGQTRFTVSWSAGGQGDEQARKFVAIAHHPDTGVMTIGKSGQEVGEAGYRLACANAASELCMSVLAITTYRRMFEVTRYAQ